MAATGCISTISAGSSDMENNLVYRVSGNAISYSWATRRTEPREHRQEQRDPGFRTPVVAELLRSLLLQHAAAASAVLHRVQQLIALRPQRLPIVLRGRSGCTYAGEAFTAYEQWTSNLFWRTDAAFATDPQAFHVQQSLDASGGCGNNKLWAYYTFAGWQGIGEDSHSVVQNPGFNNPAYPADDYTLPKGSPGVGFVVFDPTQAGRSNPVIMPPAVPATFPTKTFNSTTDF